MINSSQLRDLVIIPALKDLQLESQVAVDLMLFTCAAESDGGRYLKQINGPALGIYQMEPATYNDIWRNYISGNGRINLIMLSCFDCPSMPPEDRLIHDLRFATAMTRLYYSRIAAPLPLNSDPLLLWYYYKNYYNTKEGKAEQQNALTQYHRFVTS